MNFQEYIGQFTWVITTLIFNVVLETLNVIQKNKEKLNKPYQSIINFILLITGNCLIAYIFGITGYIKFVDKPIIPYVSIWIISFIILLVIEFVFIKLCKKDKSKALVKVSMTPQDYKELILSAEKDSQTIDLLPKRIHVMFKSNNFIMYLAKKRFGDGNKFESSYINEQIERKSNLISALINKKIIIHELHNKKDLITYIESLSHPGVDNIEKQYFKEMLENWKQCIDNYPNSYYVRLTDAHIPLKYEIIDTNKAIIHEAIGSVGNERFNAIMIEDGSVVSKIYNDFLNIWNQVPINETSGDFVIKWIDDNLLSLLND